MLYLTMIFIVDLDTYTYVHIQYAEQYSKIHVYSFLDCMIASLKKKKVLSFGKRIELTTFFDDR